MILRPKNLRQLERQLEALQENQRRVIVLAGRHANEGSYRIALRHHAEWETHGAVTVKIPKRWTPQWLWKLARKKAMTPAQVKRLFERDFAHDNGIILWLHEKGFRVPVVNLHGTGKVTGGKTRVEYHYSARGTRIPRLDKRGKIQLQPSQYASTPQELLVEAIWPYAGTPVTKTGIYARKIVAKAPMLEEDAKYATGRVGRAANEHIDQFDARHAKELERVIAQLAGIGLLKRSERRNA